MENFEQSIGRAAQEHRKKFDDEKDKLDEDEVKSWSQRIAQQKFDVEGGGKIDDDKIDDKKKEIAKNFLANRNLLIAAEKEFRDSKGEDATAEMWVKNRLNAVNRSLDVIKREILNDLMVTKYAFRKSQGQVETIEEMVKSELEDFHRIIFKFAAAAEEDLAQKRREELAEGKEKGRIRQVLERYGKLPRWKRMLISCSIAGGIGAGIGLWGGAGLAVAASIGGTRAARSLFGGSAAAGLNYLTNSWIGAKYEKLRVAERDKTEEASLKKMKEKQKEWLDNEEKRLTLMEGLDQDILALREKTGKILKKERKARLLAVIGSGIAGGLSSWALFNNVEALAAELPAVLNPTPATGAVEAPEKWIEEYGSKIREVLGDKTEISLDSPEMRALGYIPDLTDNFETVSKNLQTVLEIKNASGGVIDISEIVQNPEILDKAEYVKDVINDFKAANVDLKILDNFAEVTDAATVKTKLIEGITGHFNTLANEQDKISYLAALQGNTNLSEYTLLETLEKLRNTLKFTAENLKVDIESGDSIWKVLEKKLALASDRLVSRYSVGKFSDLASGRKDYIVDWLKDDILKNPEKYGLSGVKDLDHLTAEQLEKFANSQGLADAFNDKESVAGIFTKAGELTEAQVDAIEANREFLEQVRKAHPDLRLTGVTVEQLLDYNVHPGIASADITREIVQNMLLESEVANRLADLGTAGHQDGITITADSLAELAAKYNLPIKDAFNGAGDYTVRLGEGETVNGVVQRTIEVLDATTKEELVSTVLDTKSGVPTEYQAAEVISGLLPKAEEEIGKLGAAIKSVVTEDARGPALRLFNGGEVADLNNLGENATGVLKREVTTGALSIDLESKVKNVLTDQNFKETVSDISKLEDGVKHINNLVENNEVLAAVKGDEAIGGIWGQVMDAKVVDLDGLDGNRLTRALGIGERKVYKDFHDWFKEVAKAANIKLSEEKDSTVMSVLEKVLEKTVDGSVTIPSFKK